MVFLMLPCHNYIQEYRSELSDLLLFLCSGNQIKRWRSDYMWAFEFLGPSHTTKTKGKEKWKVSPHCFYEMITLSHPHLQCSRFLMNTDPSVKGVYLKYDVLVVLFSFLFQLLRNLMHLKPDHDPGTAFVSISGEDIRSSGVRHKVQELL